MTNLFGAAGARRPRLAFALPILAMLMSASSTARAAEGGATLEITLIDGRGRTIPALEAGDTLTVRVTGLAANSGYDIVLRDATSAPLAFVRASAQRDGTLGPEVVWYESGVSGRDPAGRGIGASGFATFADAAAFLTSHPVTLEVRAMDLAAPGKGALVGSLAVPVHAPRTTPLFFFSDGRGDYRTAFDVGSGTICVTGENLPAGSTVDLYVVPERSRHEAGERILDCTGWNGVAHGKRVQLGAGETSFRVPVWSGARQRTGRFDLVARLATGPFDPAPTLQESDFVVGDAETGIFVRPLGTAAAPQPDIITDLACVATRGQTYPGYEFQNTFLRHDSVKAGLDPTDIPPSHAGGDLAAIYVVRERSAAEWKANPGLHDVTGVVEVRPMKPGTLEFTVGTVWSDADPGGFNSVECDIVLDFIRGGVPGLPGTGTGGSAGGSGNPLFNGVYDRGIDVLDRAGGDGLTIVDDPSEPGPYPVGRSEYDFPDAYDIPWGQYADQNVDVRAVVAYPGVTAGSDVAVSANALDYPLVVILHGNHAICLGSACNHNCSQNNRIPNHKGYDYLLDLWASHGFIAVSIDGYDVTCNDDRFIERGALILEHIRYWELWNDPNVPDTTFAGRFYGRIDVAQVGIAGHSRGGEGAAAAIVINRNLSLGHNITACITIAPTDFNNVTPPGGGPKAFVIRDIPLFNIMGSSDGDVFDNQGVQLWDRASPNNGRADKSQAYIYGANHNSWNTIWIDPNWNGNDDGTGPNLISDQEQQDTGRVYMTTWFMAWLQNKKEMLAFHRGRIDSPKLDTVNTYWTYESQNHVAVDNFQDAPADPTLNSLGGAVTVSPAPPIYLESSFRPGAYDGSFFHDTDGLIVGWTQLTTYTSTIPAGSQDVSDYTHLALRVAQIWDNNTKNQGGPQHFFANLEDVNGVRQTVDINSSGFAPIPVGYRHPNTGRKSMLSSVRVPLRSFTQDNSGLDLTQITKIVITFEDTGLLAIDDIQFSK